MEVEFFPSDRLLNIPGGRLPRKDILLAQGHNELQHLPLLIFSLIQCDALRPNSGDFNPSMDSRAAAAANLSSMSADALARSIAPRLEFWISGKDSNEAVFDSVNMNVNDVRYTIIDQIGTYEDNGDEKYDGVMPILLLDSPSNFLIYDCRDFCTLRATVQDDIPDALVECKEEAIQSYRVPPPSYSLVGEGNISAQEAFNRFMDAMVEDSVTSAKHESYEVWSSILAEILYSELSE